MLEVVLSNRFKKDLKLAAKRGCDLSLLESIVDQLAAQQPLPEKNRDHDLTGDYIGFRECHIRPDWLLIYRVDGEQLMLFLFRTGTHSDLFDRCKASTPAAISGRRGALVYFSRSYRSNSFSFCASFSAFFSACFTQSSRFFCSYRAFPSLSVKASSISASCSRSYSLPST